MAQNLKLDPAKRDYVILDGKPVETDGIHEKAYFALKIPQGKYLYNTPGQGSLLFTLEGQLRDGGIDERFNAIATDAIKRQLVETGAATDVLSRNVGFGRTSTENEIDIISAQVSASNQLDFVSVG